jgi:hypothetical protein
MPLFNCSDCGVVENTALGAFWWNRRKGIPVQCSQCATGEWHGKFDRAFDVIPPDPLIDPPRLATGDTNVR